MSPEQVPKWVTRRGVGDCAQEHRAASGLPPPTPRSPSPPGAFRADLRLAGRLWAAARAGGLGPRPFAAGPPRVCALRKPWPCWRGHSSLVSVGLGGRASSRPIPAVHCRHARPPGGRGRGHLHAPRGACRERGVCAVTALTGGANDYPGHSVACGDAVSRGLQGGGRQPRGWEGSAAPPWPAAQDPQGLWGLRGGPAHMQPRGRARVGPTLPRQVTLQNPLPRQTGCGGASAACQAPGRPRGRAPATATANDRCARLGVCRHRGATSLSPSGQVQTSHLTDRPGGKQGSRTPGSSGGLAEVGRSCTVCGLGLPRQAGASGCAAPQLQAAGGAGRQDAWGGSWPSSPGEPRPLLCKERGNAPEGSVPPDTPEVPRPPS